MMSAVSYLAVVVILLAWPVNGFLQAQLAGQSGGAGVVPLALGGGGHTIDYGGVYGGAAPGRNTEGPLASVKRRFIILLGSSQRRGPC
jgi:hypothetical protein